MQDVADQMILTLSAHRPWRMVHRLHSVVDCILCPQAFGDRCMTETVVECILCTQALENGASWVDVMPPHLTPLLGEEAEKEEDEEIDQEAAEDEFDRCVYVHTGDTWDGRSGDTGEGGRSGTSAGQGGRKRGPEWRGWMSGQVLYWHTVLSRVL